MTIVYFIVGLGLLIFAHELGHFLMAKWAGIRVETFSLGFGPKIFGFTRGETEYRISVFPLGGYVKMSGEDPEENQIQPVDDPRSFAIQPLRKRVGVVLAGPLMNIFLALVLLPLAYLIGVMVPDYLKTPPVILGITKDSPTHQIGLEKGDRLLALNGVPVSSWDEVVETIVKNPEKDLTLKILRKQSGIEEEKTVRIKAVPPEKIIGFLGIEPALFMTLPKVGRVVKDSPAQEAGFEPGDKIFAVNGTKIDYSLEFSEKLEDSKGHPISVDVERNEKKMTLTVTPRFNEKADRWLVGIEWAEPQSQRVKSRYALPVAVKKGVYEILWQAKTTFITLKKIFTFEGQAYKSVGGPVQIAQMTSKAAEYGMGNFLVFLAAISLQLGIFNLLPIPVLDGGHLLFMGYEAVRRRPLSVKKRIIAQQVGMALLFTLIIVVTVKDLHSIEGVQKFFGKIVSWF